MHCQQEVLQLIFIIIPPFVYDLSIYLCFCVRLKIFGSQRQEFYLALLATLLLTVNSLILQNTVKQFQFHYY